MYLGTNSGHRVSGSGCKFEKEDILFNSRKGAKREESLFGSVHSTNYKSARFDETVRNVKLHHSSYPSSTYSVSISAITVDFNVEEGFLLHDQSDIEAHGQGRASAVEETTQT